MTAEDKGDSPKDESFNIPTSDGKTVRVNFVTQIQGRLYDITGDVTEKYQVKPWDALDDELLKKRIVRDCILF